MGVAMNKGLMANNLRFKNTVVSMNAALQFLEYLTRRSACKSKRLYFMNKYKPTRRKL